MNLLKSGISLDNIKQMSENEIAEYSAILVAISELEQDSLRR